MSRRVKVLTVALAVVTGLLPILNAAPSQSAPTNFVETDNNIIKDGAGTFDWANSGALTAPNTVGGTWTRSGTGGLFDGGKFQGNNTPPTPPIRTAASIADVTIADEEFRVDPLGSDIVPCGPNGTLTTGDPTAFTGNGSEKNNSPFSDFVYNTASVPPKDDVANVYALSHVAGATNEIFFAAERVVNNGTTHIDFEFLQAPLSISSPCGPGTFNGHRTQGDLLLSVNLANGGGVEEAELFEWRCQNPPLPGQNGQICDPPGNGNPDQKYYSKPSAGIATFGVNTGGAVGCGGWVCRNDNGTPTTSVLQFSFMEGAIDLAAAGFTGCFSSFLPHTRTSGSFTSTLKDFGAPINFSNCKQPEVATSLTGGGQSGASITVPSGTAVSDQATLTNTTGNAGGTLTYKVYTDSNCTNLSTNPAVNQTVNVSNSTVPPSSPVIFSASGTFYWQASYSGDVSLGGKNLPAISPCTAEVLTVQSPNLSLVKTSDGGTVSAGDQIGFTLTLTNNGPGQATNVNLTDALPTGSGITWSMSPVVAGCTLVGVNLSCNFGNLANGAQKIVHLVSPTTAASCKSYPNSATAVADNNPPVQDSETIDVNCPDIRVVKTAASTPINAGETASFNITVTNHGQGTAKNVTLSDTLPSGISWTENSNDCSIAGLSLTCSFGDLASGASRTFTVSGLTDAADCRTLVNTANVAAANEPSNLLEDNTSTAEILVRCPDITVVKTADNSPISAGETAAFTIVVTNAGTGVAKGATLSDQLPAGVTWTINPAVAGCSINGSGLLSCNFGDLAPQATRTIKVSGVTDAADCGLLPNLVTVAATNEAQADQGNNTSQASIAVNCADIKLFKVADAATVNAGEAIGFLITVRNDGAGTAFGVHITDTLPTTAGTSWTINGGTGQASCNINGGILTCDFASLAPGASQTVHITSPTTSATCGVVNNNAGVTTTNDGSANASAQVTVNCPNVTVLKQAVNPVISAGDVASFTILVSSTGPGTAKNVTLTDTLPTGLTWAENSTSCSINGSGVLNCSFGDLAAGQNRSVTLTATTTAANCRTLVNTAVVAATNEAPGDTGDNSSTADIEVLCPNVTVLKTADNGTINAGDTAAFTIVVSNVGAGTAKSVTLSDQLPAGVTWTINPSVAGCSINGSGLLSCSFGDLAPQATRTIHVSGVTDAADCGVLNNTATVGASNEAASDQGDNTSSATITVQCPNVSVLKTADDPVINAGDTAAFTIVVTNAGPGLAKGVTLSDTLPAGITWAEDSLDCSITAGVLNCSFGDIPGTGTLAQRSRTVHLTGATDPPDCGILENTATILLTNEPAGLAGDNTSTATIDVDCPDVRVQKVAEVPVINAGETAAFVITVTNIGDGIARNVTLTDSLPTQPGMSWSINGGTGAASCSIVSNALSCAFGDLAKNESRTVRVESPTVFASCANLPNTAIGAATNEAATDLGNNTDSASILVRCPDLSISKTADAGTVSSGSQIGFTISVTNNGPGAAKSVTLSDPLPTGAGLSWTINPANADCGIAANVLTCSFGDIPGTGTLAQRTRSVHVISPTTAASCATYPNVATAQATNHPPLTANDSVTVQCPSIHLEKTADQSPVSAGDNIGFLITVSNGGPGDATGVVITDTLPTNNGTSWSINGGTGQAQCNIASGVLTCTFPTLAAGANRTVHITSPTTAATCGTVDNTAAVTTSNDGSDDDDASVVVECPNIHITKQADAGSVSAGDPIGFTITASNSGPGTAKGVTVTDPLPSGSGINWSIDGGTGQAQCGIAAGTLSCSFGDMAAGASFTVHISSPTTAASCATYQNTATVDATNDDPVEAMASVVVNCAAIQITKTPDAATVSAGDPIGFLITVTNTGAGTAKGVTVNDPLPANGGTTWTIDGGTGQAQCGIASATLTCNFGDMGPSASFTVHISSPTTPATCGTVHNVASVATANDGSGQAPADVVVNCPNVTVLKTADNGTINAGETAAFTIVVANSGLGTAKGVTLNDTLPGGVNWAIAPAVQGCAIANGVLSCDFGDLAPGASVTIHISGVTDAADCGTLSNTATVGALNEAQADQADNSSTATITVNCPDVRVLKTADNSPINAGDTAAFTIVVSNIGTGLAKNVNLTDTLPAGVNWAIAPPVQGCAIANGALSCNFDDLASGASVTIHISGVTDAADCGTLPNTATVSADNEPQGVLGNNSSGDTITVNCPDVTVLKTADNSPISAGQTAAFTIRVSNSGAGLAKNVTLTDTLPTGVNWAISPAVQGCGIASGVLTCSFGDLAPGASIEIHISGLTDAADCGTLRNTATVGAANEPPSAQLNNSSTAEIVVQCADIDIAKVADQTTVNAGQTIGFTLTVTNNGAGTAMNVMVNDPLPNKPGLSWTVNPQVQGCSIASFTLTCNLGNLAGSGQVVIHVQSPTTAASCATLNNTATVTTSNDGTDNASATITVNCPAEGKIAPTATTCADFQAGTAADLDTLNYGVKSNKINNVAPGVFFYYSRVTAPGASFQVVITQTKNGSTPFFLVHQGQAVVYTANCQVYGRFAQTGANGQVTLNITGAATGQVFVIGVKYDPGSVVGSPVPNPTTVHYDFSTSLNGTLADSDANGLNLKKK